MATSGFEQAVEKTHKAVNELVKGNPEPQKEMFSRRGDVSLMNPLGDTVRGWEQIASILERITLQMRDGAVSFENLVAYATDELGFTVEIEHSAAKFGGRDEFTEWDLRVTTIYRPEEDGWKMAHRHADSITARQSVESLLEG